MIFGKCVVCGERPEPARRLAVSLPEGRPGVVCGHHDPEASGFREDLFYCLFRFHGLAIGDAQSAAAAETIAGLVAEALIEEGPATGSRSRSGRLPRVTPLKGAGTASCTAPPRRPGRPLHSFCGRS